METPDIPEHKPYVAGTVRGKKFFGSLDDGIDIRVCIFRLDSMYCRARAHCHSVLFVFGTNLTTARAVVTSPPVVERLPQPLVHGDVREGLQLGCTWDLVVQKLGTQQMNYALIQSCVCPISGPQGPKCNTCSHELRLPSDWIPPPQSARERNAEEQIAIDLGDEYETALTDASQEEIIDLAAILGFHSMMNQDQYHASLLNKGQPVGLGWDGITKASQPKLYPVDPPNSTDPDATIKQVKDDDHNLTDLNWNNIKVNLPPHTSIQELPNIL
ncbi:unnamed protein product [Timema podura]|uniref:Uncharacterized protein n=1 Tax=Timema podura TaxID=61482 RepID=A0ABN7P431_TIMPD|nr:unnamed protein product [Timema podura]